MMTIEPYRAILAMDAYNRTASASPNIGLVLPDNAMRIKPGATTKAL
jgi:hypothetical protein